MIWRHAHPRQNGAKHCNCGVNLLRIRSGNGCSQRIASLCRSSVVIVRWNFRGWYSLRPRLQRLPDDLARAQRCVKVVRIGGLLRKRRLAGQQRQA